VLYSMSPPKRVNFPNYDVRQGEDGTDYILDRETANLLCHYLSSDIVLHRRWELIFFNTSIASQKRYI